MGTTYWQNIGQNELRMTFKEWIDLEYNELRRITENITSNHRLTDDLFHEVILQLLNKSKDLDKIPDKEKKYYFIAAIIPPYGVIYSYSVSVYFSVISEPLLRDFSFCGISEMESLLRLV